MALKKFRNCQIFTLKIVMYNSNSSALFFFHYNYNYFIYDLIVIYYNDKLQLQIQFLIDKNFKVKLCLIFL